jgi:hypothetical protein
VARCGRVAPPPVISTSARDRAREVILSAGGRLPHILQLSGVGDPKHLAPIGVPVVHESRGVGKNMQDHYVARVSYPVIGAQTANERSRGLPLAGEVMRWLFTGKAMLSYSRSIVAASVEVLEGSATPDIAGPLCTGQLQGRPDRRTRGDAGPQRRRLADAAAAARLCRGKSERPGRGAGDQPALSVGGKRPARHHRRAANGAADCTAPALQPACRPRPAHERAELRAAVTRSASAVGAPECDRQQQCSASSRSRP